MSEPHSFVSPRSHILVSVWTGDGGRGTNPVRPAPIGCVTSSFDHGGIGLIWRCGEPKRERKNLVGMDGLLLRKEKQNSRLGLDWFWGERKMATLLAQARSALVQASSPSAQVKAAEVQAGDRNWNWGKNLIFELQEYFYIRLILLPSETS